MAKEMASRSMFPVPSKPAGTFSNKRKRNAKKKPSKKAAVTSVNDPGPSNPKKVKVSDGGKRRAAVKRATK